MSRKYLAVLAALALLSPAVAEMEFGDVDKNQDGFISAEELTVMPELQQSMTDFDLDEDGQLSEEEFTKYLDAGKPAEKGG